MHQVATQLLVEIEDTLKITVPFYLLWEYGITFHLITVKMTETNIFRKEGSVEEQPLNNIRSKNTLTKPLFHYIFHEKSVTVTYDR